MKENKYLEKIARIHGKRRIMKNINEITEKSIEVNDIIKHIKTRNKNKKS